MGIFSLLPYLPCFHYHKSISLLHLHSLFQVVFRLLLSPMHVETTLPSWYVVSSYEQTYFHKVIPMDIEDNLRTYWHLREELLKLHSYRCRDGPKYLSFTEVRTNFQPEDDASLLFAIFRFLTQEGVINKGVDAVETCSSLCASS